MRFTCLSCGAVLPVDPEKILVSPRVQCPHCGHVFRLRQRTVRDPAPPEPPTAVTVYERSDADRAPPPVRSHALTPAAAPPTTLVTVDHCQPQAISEPEPAFSGRPRRPSLAIWGLGVLTTVGFSGWLWTALRPAPLPQTALKPVVAEPAASTATSVPLAAEALIAAAPPQTPFDSGPWMSADFVLINPTHFALAMAETNSPNRFRVLAKAEEAQARRGLKTAWDSAVPIVAGDPKLARTVYARTAVNEEVPVELRPELETHWRHHEFVPTDATLVAYNDLARGQRRVGFRRNGDEGLEFRELLGTKFERIAKELVQPGTLETDLDDERLAARADFMDVCLYQICRRLASPSQQSSYLQAVVAPAVCEGEGQENLEVQIGDINQQLDGLADERAQVERRARQSGQEDERPDLGHRQRELEARKHDLETRRELTIEARRLTGEIRAKLAQLGVPLLERTESGLAAIGRERTRFQRPDFESAEQSQLLGATHLVLTDIRPPARRGRYEVSMRCVSIATGKLLWEGQGDRLNTADTALDLAGSPYLLNSGRLSVVTAAEGYRIDADEAPSVEQGGWPLVGPALKLLKLPEEPEKTTRTKPKRDKTPPRPLCWLGYVESSETGPGKPLTFRDLFRKEPQLTQSDWVGRVTPVESLKQAPEEHRMRYVVWRLAQAILPLAGRITLTGEPRQVEVGLRRQDGVRQGDRLVVLRPTALSGGGGSMDVPLPVELILTAVHDHASLAYWDAAQGTELRDNDVAHRKPKRKPMVAVMELTSDLRNMPPGDLTQVLRQFGNSEPEMRQFSEYVAKRLTILLQGAFVELEVPVVERENLDKLASEQRLDDVDTEKAVEIGHLVGATHLVLGRLSPGLNDQTAVSLRVVAVDTGMVDEQIQFSFTRAQMDGWKP